MCLTNVDEKPARKFGIGYKSVEKYKDGTYHNYDCPKRFGRVTYPLNKWFIDPQPNTDGNLDKGFHISLSKTRMDKLIPLNRNAVGRTIVTIKVRFREVIASSMYNDPIYGKQVVARQIMNLGEV